MSLRGWMFNFQASRPKNRPDDVLKALGITPGQFIADIGSGGGYYTFRFAEAIGTGGKVFPIDVDSKMLDYVKRGAGKRQLGNVVPVLTDGFPSELPQGRLDLVFSRNAYHHLVERSDYFRRLMACLAPGGRVAIIDHVEMTKSVSLHTHKGHHTTPETIVDEMIKAGYDVVAKHDFLASQSFIVFRPGSHAGGA